MSTEQPWRRVYTALRQDIDQERLRPGDQITSTRALAEEHGVAPMTVRRALAELQNLGVAAPNTASLGCLAWSWLEAMDDDGVQESGRCWFGVFSGLETVVGPTAFAGR